MTESHKTQLEQAILPAALDKSLSYLMDKEQNGWWPYFFENDPTQTHSPSIEATAWCALAIHAAGKDPEIAKRTTHFLLEKQNGDGGWSTSPGVGASDWSTAPALLALRLLNREKPAISSRALNHSVEGAADFLFDLRTNPWKSVGRLFLFLGGGPGALHYPRGWPWTKDCAFWVEPTSYSLLALKLPNLPDKMNMEAACRHAAIYLRKHVCKEGGWNHGCEQALGVFYPPYTVTTAEALLAMQDEPHSEIIERALSLITKDMFDADSCLPLAWSYLALNAYGRDGSSKLPRLLKHQHDNGSFGWSSVVTAIASIALIAAVKNDNLLKIGV